MSTRQALKLPTMAPMFDFFSFRPVVSTIICSSTSSSVVGGSVGSKAGIERWKE